MRSLILAAVTFFVFILIAEIPQYFPVEKHKIKIVDVQRVCSKSDCHWVVYTDNDIYTVEDMLLIGFVDSGNVAAKLKAHVGYYCTVETRGIRWHFPTYYKNIVKVYNCTKE